MSIEMNGAGIGSAAWKLLNTGLGAARYGNGSNRVGFKDQRRKGSSDYP